MGAWRRRRQTWGKVEMSFHVESHPREFTGVCAPSSSSVINNRRGIDKRPGPSDHPPRHRVQTDRALTSHCGPTTQTARFRASLTGSAPPETEQMERSEYKYKSRSLSLYII